MPAVELTCLQTLADLEQLEGPCMDALSDGDPEGVATVLRLGLSHMAMTAKRLTDAMVLDRLDAEELLEKGESTALTFASNPACRGMQRQAGESVNPVSD
ncbi:hypothetical protein [Synechococcus sp. UW105]|uniref:hypothetical protein n=1 Tax=Synechococcus sp. UW105 TaxID=337067 RepID=UPI000E0F1A61|nr:hypothetical protein [Synechococcus sp. UW105]